MTTPFADSVLAPGRLRLLLLSLLLYFGGIAAAAGSTYEPPVDAALLTLVVVAAVTELRERRMKGVVAVALAGAVIVLSALKVNVRIGHLPVAASGVVALLAGLVVWRTYTGVMRPQRAVGDRIVGAICVYLMIGLAWAKVYETLEAVVPGSFGFPAHTHPSTVSLAHFTYLSFVTLTTLGYGDITPTTAVARTLAWLEAVTGQLYLAITVARLVALSLGETRDQVR